MHFQTSKFVIILVVFVAVIVVSPIAPVFADPQAMLTAPTIVDVSLTPGTTFSIEISVKRVSMMFGYQFLLSYNSSVLTATSFMSYEPFTKGWPSKVNDTAGYVDVAYCMQMPEWFGFDTSKPAPIIRIDFEVDSYGYSVLDLHDTVLTDVYANFTSHKVGDGFFSNIQMEPPRLPITSEPPSQPAEPSNAQSPLTPSIPYVATPNAAESQSSSLNYYVGVRLAETYNATGASCWTHIYTNYVYLYERQQLCFHLALVRTNTTHMEWVEAGFKQNRTTPNRYPGKFYLYIGWGVKLLDEEPLYKEISCNITSLTDHFLEIIKTTSETFEVRVDSDLLTKTYTFSIHGDKIYQAEGESGNLGTNSMRGHFWDLKYYDSDGISHTWKQVEPYEAKDAGGTTIYFVGFSGWTATDNFYTGGGEMYYDGGMVLKQVFGDITGDGTVDMMDVSELNVHWWDIGVSGILGYDSNADINPWLVPDGFVNIFDKAYLNWHWKETLLWRQ